MLPGVGKVKRQLAEANIDIKLLDRQQAIIGSMTPAERRNPKILNSSRKRRIAGGSGTTVQDVNRVLKSGEADEHRDEAGAQAGREGPDAARNSRPGAAPLTPELRTKRVERPCHLKIRLSRAGAKKRPFYRVVVADTRSPA